MNDESTRLLARLFQLVEEDSENFFKYTRHGAEWRREVMDALDRIENSLRHPKPPVTPSDLKHLATKYAPWIIAGLSALGHVLRSLHL